MTSKEAVKLARKEFQKDFLDGEETNEWLSRVIKGLEQAENDLEVLHYLANLLDNNTLFRMLPYDKAKVISDYIDNANKYHPEIREVLNRISNEMWEN